MSADGAALPVLASSLGDVAPHGFFAPVPRSLVEGLIEQCRRDEERIGAIATTAEQFFAGNLSHFLKGNLSADRRPSEGSVTEIFKKDGAIKHLHADYWVRALALTDVYDFLPQKRRDDWNNSIQKMETPAFTAENVEATLRDLLVSRERFLAERVDFLFKNLSGEHVTNSPEAFGKRMIIGYMLSYGSVRCERAGLIHDLRCVIAKFMSRDQPSYHDNHALISELQKATGEWHVVDGGALRVRLYKKGTAHLEVHPEMAYRLNMVLSVLYPQAIPAPYRQKPSKKAKAFAVFGRPLPFAVLAHFAKDTRYMPPQVYRMWSDDRYEKPTPARDEAVRVIESLGGVQTGKGEFTFDYDYRPVFKELQISGCIPDQVSHQFYPTPAPVAEQVIAAAQIGEHDTCLEPSAGQGHLASLLPADRTTCVEISALHCRILRAKGLKVAERDFLEWGAEQRAAGRSWSRIVMNPPFSEGRAQLHLEAASQLLAAGGRLVAVLPASHRGRSAPKGWTYEWSAPIQGEFEGTSVAVVILTARRT